MKIGFCKTGQVLRSENRRDGTSSLGDSRNALGILQYLIDAGHDVVLFGAVKGEFDCKTEPADLYGIDGLSTQARQTQMIDDLAKRVGKIDVIVHVTGPEGSAYSIDNPNFAAIHTSSMRYVACTYGVFDRLRVPRIDVVTDPRLFPRTQELTWKNMPPACVLSQQELRFDRTMAGKRWKVHAAYAGVENWWQHGWTPPVPQARNVVCCAIANSHFYDKRWSKGRREVWKKILYNGVTVVGGGWEGGPGTFVGSVDPVAATRWLARSVCGPCVAPTEGWLTPKLGRYARCGCLPLVWNGTPLRYDPEHVYVSHDDPLRFEDLAEKVRWALGLKSWVRRGLIEWVVKQTKADFSTLDRALAGEQIGSWT